MKTSSINPALLTAILLSAHFAVADEPQNGNTVKESQSISISVNSSSEDDGVNGPQSKVSGKIMITGPDGVQKEINLGDALPNGFNLDAEGLPGQLSLLLKSTEAAEPRPMIGVASEPVNELLRTHLKLGINGVVVIGVSEGMPAAEAGIVKGDIILTAAGKNITNMQDLAVVVKESAEEEFDVELIHEGERKTVKLTAKVTAPDEVVMLDLGAGQKQLNRFLQRGMGPGMQLHGNQDLEKQIARLMEQTRKAAMDARKQSPKERNLNRQLAQLRERVAELEKRLEDAKTADNETE